jgi:hypothetical protein
MALGLPPDSQAAIAWRAGEAVLRPPAALFARARFFARALRAARASRRASCREASRLSWERIRSSSLTRASGAVAAGAASVVLLPSSATAIATGAESTPAATADASVLRFKEDLQSSGAA